MSEVLIIGDGSLGEVTADLAQDLGRGEIVRPGIGVAGNSARVAR